MPVDQLKGDACRPLLFLISALQQDSMWKWYVMEDMSQYWSSEGKLTRMRRLYLKTSEAEGRGGLGMTSSSEEFIWITSSSDLPHNLLQRYMWRKPVGWPILPTGRTIEVLAGRSISRVKLNKYKPQ